MSNPYVKFYNQEQPVLEQGAITCIKDKPIIVIGNGTGDPPSCIVGNNGYELIVKRCEFIDTQESPTYTESGTQDGYATCSTSFLLLSNIAHACCDIANSCLYTSSTGARLTLNSCRITWLHGDEWECEYYILHHRCNI